MKDFSRDTAPEPTVYSIPKVGSLVISCHGARETILKHVANSGSGQPAHPHNVMIKVFAVRLRHL